MKTIALRAFYVNDKIGLFKFIDGAGYAIKVMGVGRSGVVVGECDNGFNLVSLEDSQKKELVLSALNKLNKDKHRLEFVEKVNIRLLTKHYKFSKYLT